ncbi:piRNA biogenesis protein EXD1-like [Anopheles ziemanni]|uniref:piRNA biogenesis protein EXD1-like n=1 Tax=Anopheles coustani TaxID=139045 RepID=UPI00265AB857|nr:piRNA biogenesis protein EXD1-like [Anopheles coustani]XP_058166518.1 piRNA biogenesis protein EXD1-like [Anopheles ziemanni]
MDKVDLKVGQKLLLQIQNASFEGELRYVSADRKFMRLSNVRDVLTNNQLGEQDYYYSEVEWIQVLENPPAETSPSDDSSSSKAEIPTESKISKCFDEVLKKIEKCKFIQQTDTVDYHNSIKYIQNQNEFGISMEYIGDGQDSITPSLLSIVTSHCIIVLDIKTMGMTTEVGELLSNDCYMRVFHNGRWMKDALLKNFGITLGRCFDTMVVHNILTEADTNTIDESPMDTEVSIQSCVAKYLKLPDKFFDMDVNFTERPLTDACKQEAAKRVAFLLDLWNHIVHDRMLEKLYESCVVYADSLASHKDLIDSLTVMRCRRSEALTEIKPFP